MRRPTLITLVVLLAFLVGAAIYQVSLASRDQRPLPGPTSPGQLPSRPAASS
ncbi:MAG: hypothetical protein ABI635_09345 [Actinomycetota bacterium]